jgi:ABC-2 type transport system permease protein
MTATVLEVPTRVRTDERLTFGRLLRSEWIKLATLRSTWWSIAIVAVLSIGLSLLIAVSLASSFQPEAVAAAKAAGRPMHVDSVMAILGPTQFTMLLAGILGAIAITGEYSTGMIRSTLTAEPRRGAVLGAKAIVVGALLAVTSLVVFAVAAVATMPALTQIPLDWSTPADTLLPILYGALSMAAFALIGLSCGFMIRNGAGAIAATVAILFILPIVSAIFPSNEDWKWVHTASNYLPMLAAQSLMTAGGAGTLTVPVAALALAGWVAVGVLGSWAVLRTRDA